MISRIIITHPHSLEAPGGGTRSCLQMINHLEKLGVEVIVVPVTPEPEKQIKLPGGTEIIPVAKNSIHYLLSGRKVAQVVQEIIAQKPVDAVISWEHEGAFLPQLLQSQPVVFAMIAAMPSYAEWIDRQTGFHWLKSKVDDWFRWRLFRKADMVFVSSQFTQGELTTILGVKPERITITARGIDRAFGEIKRQFSGEINNLIFYGSFAPIKGVFDVILALGKLSAQGHVNWKLKLAGWGNEESVEQALVSQGIRLQTELLGCLNREQLAQELGKADMAILPSRAESFGRAIAEAQAGGLPVVSYATGSIPEIVHSGVTGLLVPPQEINKLSQAILQMMKSPEKTYQMGVAGRKLVSKQFSWEKTVKKMLAGIEEAKMK